MSQQEYGTIRIPRDEYERHNERRKAEGLTWVEYINQVDVSNELATDDYVTPSEVREIAREEINENVVLEALE